MWGEGSCPHPFVLRLHEAEGLILQLDLLEDPLYSLPTHISPRRGPPFHPRLPSSRFALLLGSFGGAPVAFRSSTAGPRYSRGQTRVDHVPLPHLAGVSRRRLPLPSERGLAPQPLEKSGENTRLPVCPLTGGSRAKGRLVDQPNPSHCRRERGPEDHARSAFQREPSPLSLTTEGRGHWTPVSLPPVKNGGRRGREPPSALQRSPLLLGVGGRYYANDSPSFPLLGGVAFGQVR